MANHKVGDEVFWNTRERLILEDLQDSQKLNEIIFELLGRASGMSDWATGLSQQSYGGVLKGFSVTELPSPGMSVRVNAGWALGFNDNWAADDRSRFRPVMLPSGSIDLSISNNTSGNPRKDLVVIQPSNYSAESELRDVFDVATETFSATSVYKRKRNILDPSENGLDSSASIRVVEGTPSGSPSAPSTPPYCIPIAVVDVASGATSITNSEIASEYKRLSLDFSEPEIVCSAGNTGTIVHKIEKGGATISLNTHTSPGVYQYDVSGFDNINDINVLIGVGSTGGGFASWAPFTSPDRVVIYTFDASGAAADIAHNFKVETTELTEHPSF